MFNYIIYHKSCSDGFASAYIAWKVNGDNSTYIPLSYHDKLPDIKNSNLLICDFSFDFNITNNYIKNNNVFFNIDHHKSAFDNLKDLPQKYKYFDNDHSGAYLTWKYFFNELEVPRFIKLIEDYDLWKFKYKETKPFIIALNEIPFNFKIWQKLEDETYLNDLINKGKVLLSYQENIVNIIYKNAKIKSQKIGENYYNIAYVNTNCFKNEVADKLMLETDCDFSVVYNYDDSKDITKFSLRSIDSKTDVSHICKIIGGGGHRNSAGYCKPGFHNSLI